MFSVVPSVVPSVVLVLGGLLPVSLTSAHASERVRETRDPNVAAIPAAAESSVDEAAALVAVVDHQALDQLEDVIAELSAADARARDLAERSLAPYLRDPRIIKEAFALAGASGSPEARQRLARALVQDGRTFCALTICARSMAYAAGRADGRDLDATTSDAGSIRRLLRLSMEAALAVEGPPLPLRGDLEDRPFVFREGLVTGVRVPLGPAIPFGSWVRWMTLCLPSARPLVVDARLDLASIAAVDLKELLPTTADALLKRVLTHRDLGVIDLGVAFVITTREDVDSIEKRFAAALEDPAPEREDDGEARRRERRLLDRARADWLVERLLDPQIVDGHLARLLQAIAPVGSRAALASIAGAPDPSGIGEEIGSEPEHGADESASRGLLSEFAEFGVDPTLDLQRISAASSGAHPAEVQQLAFFDLIRRPETAEVIVHALLDRPDRRTLSFACGLAAELRLHTALESLRRIAHGELGDDLTPEERSDAALAAFEIAPLDPSVRALLTRSLGVGVDPGSLAHAVEAALILVRSDPTGEVAAASALAGAWLASDAAGTSIIGAAVAALAVGRGGAEGAAVAAFKEIVDAAGTVGAEAWLLARAGSPLADDPLDAEVITAGLALDLAASVETMLRAHASRREKASLTDQVAAAGQVGANGLAALVLEAIRDLRHDGYRASFVKAALGRSSGSVEKAAVVAELAEVLRATNAGAEVLWLDPRRTPPP